MVYPKPPTDGGAAFPHNVNTVPEVGMSLRDYFAAKALEGLCANPRWNVSNQIGEATTTAYRLADGMLLQRTR